MSDTRTETSERSEQGPAGLARVPLAPLDRRLLALLIVVYAAIYGSVMGAYGMFDPWETHYTEVARQFMVRGDWLSTYWHNGTGPEGWSETNFWSKPVGSFWLSGLSLKLFGYGAHTTGEELTLGHPEWAVRLPFVLCGLFGVICVFVMASRLFGRRAGLITGLVLTTAPMYFSIARQAMTDMPYAGLITGGLALFVLAICGEKEPLPRKRARLLGRQISWPHAPIYYAFIAAFLLIMVLQMVAIVPPLLRVPIGGGPVSAAVWMIGWGLLALVFVGLSLRTRTRNEVYLYIFYAATAYAGLAKGLIGALQPGLMILAFLAVSREWRLLTEVALGRGLMVALAIFCPWYHGMLLKYGRAWWNEFFGTEQFRRLTIGEQSQAKGTHEYYIKQIGYGLFPWVALLPAALTRPFRASRPARDGRERAILFVAVWFVVTVALFTLTVTKYHHYILPAIGPGAILAGIYLDDLLAGRARGASAGIFAGAVLLLLVTVDMVVQPAHWVWMYTYLYDDNWARGVPEGTIIGVYGAAAGVCLVALGWQRLRRWAMVALFAVSIGLGGYVLNWYQLSVAPNWSQKYVLQTYYKMRKSPEEKLVAWQFNWRGETWYTAAEVVVSKSLDNTAIQAWLKERIGTRFFFITERSRYGGLRSMLPTERARQTLKIVDNSNVHYVLAAATM